MSLDLNKVCGFPFNINIADLESLFMDAKGPQKDGNQPYYYGHNLGSFANTDRIRDFVKSVIDTSTHYSGYGGYTNILQNFLTKIDRYNTAVVPTNSMHRGFTFITRPRLNLTGANLHQHPLLTTLHNSNERSVSFMIRALLDTRLSRGTPLALDGAITPDQTVTDEVSEFATAAAISPLFDPSNPFFVPLMNGLVGISGFPDFVIEPETSQGDFHGGDMTYAKGSDFMNRSQELSLEFRDVGGSIILSCFYYWCMYIALQAKGEVMAYPDDIYERRLNYTVSIYRFITDLTGSQVLWWAKATGCFPRSAPVGALFNISQGEVDIASARNFTIPFTVNDVKVNDAGTLFDFNQLVERYQPYINKSDMFVAIGNGAEHNFAALPYLVTEPNEGIKMQWRTNVRYLDDSFVIKGKDIKFDPVTKMTEQMDTIQKEQFADIEEALQMAGIEPRLPTDEEEERETIDGSELITPNTSWRPTESWRI